MSKITDCFDRDDVGGNLAVYDSDPNGNTYYATEFGWEVHRGPAIRVPLFPFTDVEVEDRCILLLLEAAKEHGWRSRRAYEDAEHAFNSRDYSLHAMISSSDHRLVPSRHRIAVAEPEQVGRIVVAGSKRGVVLFNPEAVIGYKGLGRTSYEHVLLDFLAA